MDAPGTKEGTLNAEENGPSCEAFPAPERRILCRNDVIVWRMSKACYGALDFAMNLSRAVSSKSNLQERPVSKVPVTISDSPRAQAKLYRDRHNKNVAKVLELIDELRSWISLCKPVESPQRYGNTSFRNWHLMLNEVRLALRVSQPEAF